MQVPSRLVKAQDGTRMNGTIGGRFRSGMTLFDGSLTLADFFSRHIDLTEIPEVKDLMGGIAASWSSWKGKIGVELGAGLGLPSIVLSDLGAKMIATDGDDTVLHLLGVNVGRNHRRAGWKSSFGASPNRW